MLADLKDFSGVFCYAPALFHDEFLISRLAKHSLSGLCIVVVEQGINIVLQYTFRVNFKTHFFIHFCNSVVVQLMHLLPIQLKTVHDDFH